MRLAGQLLCLLLNVLDGQLIDSETQLHSSYSFDYCILCFAVVYTELCTEINDIEFIAEAEIQSSQIGF